MSRSPFPALHTKANEAAARKAEGAHAARERADQFLSEIDSLLGADDSTLGCQTASRAA